jgi:TPR repeat protein
MRYLVVAIVASTCPNLGLGQTGAADQLAKLNSLRERAEKGDAKAQSEIATLYELGLGGTKQDYVEALKWYRKSAEQGDAGGKQGLARMYFEGKGVRRDYEEAARWYGCPKPSIQVMEE